MARFPKVEADPVAGANLATHAALTTAAHGGIVASADARLSDARTPTAHKATHATGGTDALTPADIGAARGFRRGGVTDQMTAFALPALNAIRQNTTGKNIHITALVGVVSNPQQNGHMYAEVSIDQVTWNGIDYQAFRNNQTSGTGGGTVQSGGPNLGAGQGLQLFVPDGWYWRLRTATIAGYSAPTYTYESGFGYFWQELDS